MVVHVLDQPGVLKGGGPVGVVLAPTRELAEQIHKEARKFAKPYGGSGPRGLVQCKGLWRVCVSVRRGLEV